MRYGFIGLGHLGAHLARSLVRAGFPTAVCDLDRAKAEPLLAAGAAWVATPLELARQVDAAITCMPSPKATAAVLDGVLAGLQAGATWIEMSTNGPAEIGRFAALAAERGIATLEAPVTGGVHRAGGVAGTGGPGELGRVDVGAGGDEHRPRPGGGGRPQHLDPPGYDRPGLGRRVLPGPDRVDRGGQVDPGVGTHPVGQGGQPTLGDVHAVEADPAPPSGLGQVGQVPVGEVVDHHQLVTLGLEPVDQARPKEPGPTGHDHQHVSSRVVPLGAV